MKRLSSIWLSRALYSFAQTCMEYKSLLNYIPLRQHQPAGRSHGALQPRCLQGSLGWGRGWWQAPRENTLQGMGPWVRTEPPFSTPCSCSGQSRWVNATTPPGQAASGSPRRCLYAARLVSVRAWWCHSHAISPTRGMKGTGWFSWVAIGYKEKCPHSYNMTWSFIAWFFCISRVATKSGNTGVMDWIVPS